MGDADAPDLPSSGLGAVDSLLVCPPRGVGSGIRGGSTFSGFVFAWLCIVLLGACAVLMLEYGVSLLFFGLSVSVSGVASRLPSRLIRGPAFSYASNGFLNTLLLFAGVADAGLWAACVIGEGLRLTGAG